MVEVRRADFYGTGNAMSYPVIYTGPAHAGTTWDGVEGARICGRVAQDCVNFSSTFICVSSYKDLNQGNPVVTDF